MNEEPDKPSLLKAWSFVLIQGILLASLVFLNRGIGWQVTRFIAFGTLVEAVGVVGILICASSLGRSLTAVPIPKDKAQLSTSGLYKYVRHPMYTSVLIFSAGIALNSGSAVKYGLVLALCVLFYFKSVFEERYLRRKYPEYGEYAQRIGRFLPLVKF